MLIKKVLLDDDENRTPIRLKLKALSFITYVWQERNINGLCGDCDNSIIDTEAESNNSVLENVCYFFTVYRLKLDYILRLKIVV